MEIPDTVPRGFPCFLCQRTNRRIDDPSATIEFKNPKKKEEEEEDFFFSKTLGEWTKEDSPRRNLISLSGADWEVGPR